MGVLFSSPFTYADGQLSTLDSTNWQVANSLTDITVSGNTAIAALGGIDCGADAKTVSAALTDQWAEVKVTWASGSTGGVSLRSANASNTRYTIVIEGTPGASATLTVFRYPSGTLESSQTVSFASGDTLYAQIVGTTASFKKGTTSGAGGTSIGTPVSLVGGISAGRPAVWANGDDIVLDDFVCGDFTGGSPVAPRAQAHYRRRRGY